MTDQTNTETQEAQVATDTPAQTDTPVVEESTTTQSTTETPAAEDQGSDTAASGDVSSTETDAPAQEVEATETADTTVSTPTEEAADPVEQDVSTDTAASAEPETAVDNSTTNTTTDEPAATTPTPAPAPVSVTSSVSVLPSVIDIPGIAVKAGKVTAATLSGIPEVDAIIENVPAANKAIFARLADYARLMAPKRPVSVTDGARQQVSMFRTIQNLINNEENNFSELFTALLKFIHHHRDGVFHDTHVFRFYENMVLNSDELKAFTNIMHVLRAMADPSTRALASKSINFQRALQFGLTDRGRSKITDYFKL
jgi:hypothetical protein